MPGSGLSKYRGAGMKLDIQADVEKFIADHQYGAAVLPDLLRDVLRGEAGDAIKRDAVRRTPKRTGATAASIGIWETPDGAVQVGPRPGATHPKRARGGQDSKYSGMPIDQITLWLESGAPPHKISPYRKRAGVRGLFGRSKPLAFGGRVYWSVNHPGFRGRKIMSKSLRATRWEVEAAVIDEINTGWAPKVGYR